MNDETPEVLRPPETAEWMPAGFREPPTRWLRGRLDEVIPALPEFDRGAFALAPENEGPWHANELLDLVSTREAGDGLWARRPVAVVSKRYRLIGHRAAAAHLADALASVGIEPDGLDTHASLERYGARLALEVSLGAPWMVNPGDGHPLVLQLRCLNSVDASAMLRVCFTWYRLVCTNGLVVGFSKIVGRVAHRESRFAPDVRDEIARGLALAREDRVSMARWLGRPVDPGRLAAFADGALKDRWGVRDAARFLHIARTGHDAEFEDRFQPGKPSEKTMVSTLAVPGSPNAARTEWDVAQALSWVARDRRDPSEHLDRLLDIPRLVAEIRRTIAAGAGRTSGPRNRRLRLSGTHQQQQRPDAQQQRGKRHHPAQERHAAQQAEHDHGEDGRRDLPARARGGLRAPAPKRQLPEGDAGGDVAHDQQREVEKDGKQRKRNADHGDQEDRGGDRHAYQRDEADQK